MSRRLLGLVEVAGRSAAAITVPGVKSSDRKPLSWTFSGWRRVLRDWMRAVAAWRSLASELGLLMTFSASATCLFSRVTSF